jgi:hypothetical protein
MGQNDLPNPTANIETIPIGSLVIPMDNSMQSNAGYFNLKAYGLVNFLLQNNIPVKWAIKVGKAKDGIDFSADAQRIKPSVQFPNWFDFRCGPFIVDSSYATAAKTLASTFGGNVTLYQLTANANINIRYTLTFKPKIAICSNGGDQSIHLNALTAAGMNNASWVFVVPASQIVPYCGYTIVSELHWSTSGDTARTRAIYRYIKNGGNFFAQCSSVESYEDDDTLMTTTGISTQSGSTMAYLNADLPIMQFDGALSNPGGALEYWNRNSSGAFRSTTYTGIQTSGSPIYQYLNGAKVISNSIPGGNVFYLGGHDYDNTTSSGEINGRRIYLNAIFVPTNPTAWCSTLPVSLLYFQGLPDANKLLLRWATASEENNDYFIIERSRDGIEYTQFQIVSGNGTQSSVSYYSTEDMVPFSGTSYYRLTQVDFDGVRETFDPIKVDFGYKEELFSIYPNPAVKGITIESSEKIGSVYRIELSDLCSGTSIIREVNMKRNSGEYFLEFPEDIHPGIYSLKLSDDYHESVFKLVIQAQKP